MYMKKNERKRSFGSSELLAKQTGDLSLPDPETWNPMS